jgi:hypothetical protein
MMRLIPVVLVALAAPPPLAAQEAPSEDWAAVVETAVSHRRFAIRRAAAGRIAQGADAAVPALRAHAAAEGQDSLPLELVEAIATSPATGPAIEALLEEWAADRSFFWRAQALGGLARRGIARLAPVFRRAVEDPSHLYRIEGARGLLAVGDEDGDRGRVRALLDDPDPRTRLRVALLLLEIGDRTGTGAILAAVDGAGRRFVDDAWGAREAVFALREVRRIIGRDFAAALDEDGDEREAALVAVRAWAGVAGPAHPSPPEPEAVGGVEIRSCRNGDLFLRWTADGRFFAGLDPLEPLAVPDRDRGALEAALPGLAGVAIHGRVVCDFARLYVPASPGGDRPEVHHKAAPGALPPAVLEWLKTLASSLDESGEGPRLRSRLGQFAASDRDDQ